MTIEKFPNDCSIEVSALCFDYGTQKIGVAFGQSVSATAKPVSVIKAIDGIPNWNTVSKLVEEWKPDLFVVGMPYNLDGTPSEFSPRAIKFANRLSGRFNIPAFGMDERLSSKAAIEKVREESCTNKNVAEIDDIAAQIILENWFTGYKNKLL